MCDDSKKLMAWLDCEFGSDEMADIKRHIEHCRECRKQLAAYEHVSVAFDAYCDALMAAKTRRRRLPRWVPVVSTAAVAVAAAVLLVLPWARVEPLGPPPPVKALPRAIVLETAPVPVKQVPRQQVPVRVPRQTANWLPTEPAIQISIPAESMFPPGAVPEGVNFIADLSIAADGSAEQIRLQPRLIGFERKGTQP